MSDRYSQIKKYSLVSFVVFAIFAVLGVVFNYLRPEDADLFFSTIERELSFVTDFNFFATFLFLFINNTITIVIGTFLGSLFAVVPILFLAINGFVIGLVSGYVYPTFGGFGLLISLAPHGVFELTAMFIGMGSGIYLGHLAIEEIREGELTVKKILKKVRKLEFPSKKIKEGYGLVFNIFIRIVLPLLFLAAVIEALLISIV